MMPLPSKFGDDRFADVPELRTIEPAHWDGLADKLGKREEGAFWTRRRPRYVCSRAL